MFWRMIFRALKRPRGKLAAIALTVALGVSLATAMLNVLFDVGDKVNQELKSYGANLTVLPKSLSLLDDTYALAEDDGHDSPRQLLKESDLHKIKMIFWAYNIVDFAPFLDAEIAVDGQPVTIVGTWFGKHLRLPTGDEAHAGLKGVKTWWQVDGQWGVDRDATGVMIGAALAGRLGVGVGDVLPLSAVEGPSFGTVSVRGIFHDGGPDDDRIFAPLGLVQAMTGLFDGVARVEVSALTTPENDLARRAAQDPSSLSRSEWDTWYCTAYISSIAYQIEEILPDARVKTNLRVADSEGLILEKTQLLMLLLTVAAIVCSALAISNLVTACVIEATTELGLLRALGATTGAVMVLVMTEILIAAFAGGVLGYFVGLGFAQIVGHSVFNAAIDIKAIVIPIVALLVVIMTFLGSLPALRLLMALKPTEVLHAR